MHLILSSARPLFLNQHLPFPKAAELASVNASFSSVMIVCCAGNAVAVVTTISAIAAAIVPFPPPPNGRLIKYTVLGSNRQRCK